MPGTTLEYNNVLLKNVLTERFEQTCKYDESNTDLLYHQFDIQVQGIVAISGQFGPTGASVAGGNATEMMANLHCLLMHPRQGFRFVVGEEVLLQASPNSADWFRDVNNGPKPVSCNITNIAGTRVYRISYAIQVCQVRCCSTEYDPSQAGSVTMPTTSADVLNHRWNMTETKDADFYTTREWEGQLRVAHADFNPQWIRHMVVPRQTAGYRRLRQQFTATRDGLNLKYSISDKQEYAAPPWPATSWRGVYREGIGPAGKVGMAHCEVELTGPPEASKADLLTRCAQVVMDRIRFSEAPEHLPGECILQSAMILEYIEENRVSMSVDYLRTPGKGEAFEVAYQKYLNMSIGRMAKTLDPGVVTNYEPLAWPRCNPYDSATPVGAFLMYLQSPCDQGHGMPYNEPTSPEQPFKPPYESGVPASQDDYGITDQLPYEQYNNLRDYHTAHPYTHVEVTQRYETDHGKAHIPLGYDASAATDATAVVVKVHAPLSKRIVTMTAERVGDWPELPRPTDQKDGNYVQETLLKETLLSYNRQIMADGKNYLHRMEVEFEYGLARPLTANEIVRSGSDPSDETGPDQSPFRIGDYTQGLIETYQQ